MSSQAHCGGDLHGHRTHLRPLVLDFIDDSLAVHPPHESEIGPYRGKLLTVSEMVMNHVR